MMSRRVGLWLVGAFGGVGSTAALGLAALRRELTAEVGLVTALPFFSGLDMDAFDAWVVGGHDIRRSDFVAGASELKERARLFDAELVRACADDLETWSSNVRPGIFLDGDDPVNRMADWRGARQGVPALEAIRRIQGDLIQFRETHGLEDVAVINVASTEPPFPITELHASAERLQSAIGKQEGERVLPASGLYAWAALDLGLPYINFTPSLGASFPAAVDWAVQRRTVVAGQDAKTGETLLKTALAPLFAARNLRVLSWSGTNILGNRDGLVLQDPRHKESKLRSKDQVLADILGYQPESRVSIEYVQSLDDWKTAWDHVHFQGFLGVKMSLQFTWQGADSALAAPLVLDLARLAVLAHRRGEAGILKHLACFFKSPMGAVGQDFFEQFRMLTTYAAACRR